jgi:hypothetical protein
MLHFSVLVALATSCTAPCNSGGVEFHFADSGNDHPECRIRMSGIVVVTGPHSRLEADGSTSLTSDGSEREIEVRINPVTKPIDETSEDFRGLGGVETTKPAPSDPEDVAVEQKIGESLNAFGGLDLIRARSATIGAKSEQGYVIVLHDALMHGAARPLPTITVSWYDDSR